MKVQGVLNVLLKIRKAAKELGGGRQKVKVQGFLNVIVEIQNVAK